MQLAILIAVIGALAQGDAPGQPVGDALRRTLLMLGGTLVAPLAATIGSWRLSRDLAGGEFERLRENFPKLQSLVIVLWLAIVLCTMYLVEWPRVVRGDWSLAAWPLVDELLVLLPVVVPLVLYWSALARFEWLARSAAARQLGLAPPPWRLAATLASRVRHELGLVLGPALAVIAAQETLRLVWPAAGDSQQAWWLYGPLLIAMLLFLPLMVRRLWRTEPLEPGPLRDRLFAIARAQRAGIREILVWNTDGQLANAAVVGLAGGLRYVFLTDALLARLTDDQIAAVMRHELGHVRGRHLPLRLLVLLLPAAAWLAMGHAFPAATSQLTSSLASLGLSPAAQMSILLPAGLAAYAWLVVGRYSHWLEHDADLATSISPEGVVDLAGTDDFELALRKVAGRGESRWSAWLHPTVNDRVRLLRAATRDPRLAARLRWRMRLVAWLIVALYGLLAVGVLAVSA